MTSFGASEIRIGEVLFRSEAHIIVACELYGSGRKPDALLQAARPITDVLPALESELRSAAVPMKTFFHATATIGAEIRRNAKPRALRRRLKDIATARAGLLEAMVGDVAVRSDYAASVAVALLNGVGERYRKAVDDENLGEYQAAYAIAGRARDLLADAEAVTPLLRSLVTVLPAVEPPPKLTRPDDVDRLVEDLSHIAVEELGAVRAEWTLADSLQRVDLLLTDVVSSYEAGQGPLAARLAASLFLRAYDPIREQLAVVAPDEEARLTSLLGFELRSAINDSAPGARVRDLTAEARRIVEAVMTERIRTVT